MIFLWRTIPEFSDKSIHFGSLGNSHVQEQLEKLNGVRIQSLPIGLSGAEVSGRSILIEYFPNLLRQCRRGVRLPEERHALV